MGKNKEIYNEIVEMLELGLTHVEIAEEYRVKEQVVLAIDIARLKKDNNEIRKDYHNAKEESNRENSYIPSKQTVAKIAVGACFFALIGIPIGMV